MNEPASMTTAQEEALKKAWTLLSEHFDRCLLVIDFETTGEDGKLVDAHAGYWHGGAFAACGMAKWAQERIIDVSYRSNEP